MTTERRRLVTLIIATVLFGAWISWLAYLVTQTPGRQEVLLRPQFLVARDIVIAELALGADEKGPNPTVTVKEVYRSQNDELKAGQEILIDDLSLQPDGWTGPGLYILPLIRGLRDAYEIAPIPRSPGYFGNEKTHRIYPVNPRTLGQLLQITGQ